MVSFNSTYLWGHGELAIFDNVDLLKCYKNKYINGIYVSTSDGLAENRIIEAPLNFESQYGDELSEIYSLNAKQLRISESAYKFWDEVGKLIYETGGLYETQPFRLTGNISCVSDEDIGVIGIFEVAGVSEMRDYFFRPYEINIFDFYCVLDTIGVKSLPWEMVRNHSFVYEDDNGLFFTSFDECFDCTERGGSTVIPPFWEY